MPMYYKLKYEKQQTKDDRNRTIERLLDLRKQLTQELPRRSVKDSLLLATWNIRDFGGSRLNPSPRLPEAYYYMAEIISAFDLVAIQEVNRNMVDFQRLTEILGSNWRFIATDATEGRGGNDERMVFVYDTGKVLFQNIVGEIVLPKSATPTDVEQFARTPFLVKFQTGWLKFNLCTVHLYYGDESGEGKQRRIEEINKICAFLKKRAEEENESYILLGDMNVVSPTDDTMKPLKEHDFILPAELVHGVIPPQFASNMNQNKFYDQIAFYNKRNELELGDSANKAGVFNFYKSVYRESEFATYFPLASNKDKTNENGVRIWPDDDTGKKKYFSKEWRTWQMSDHLPLWVELKIDFTDRYLKSLKLT